MEDEYITEQVTKAREHVETALGTLDRLVEENRRLAEVPGHRTSASARVAEGQQEIIDLESQAGELESRAQELESFER